MAESPIRPQIFTRFFSIRFKPEDVEKLQRIARGKGYGTPDDKLNKQPRSGITRLIREIVVEWLVKQK